MIRRHGAVGPARGSRRRTGVGARWSRLLPLPVLRPLLRPLLPLLLVALAGAPRRAAAQVEPTAILEGLRVSRSRPIDFHAARFPDTVYVGQQVTYQVAVLLTEAARTRLRRNPEFVPPELRGMLAYELGQSLRRNAVADGVPYEAFVFQRALFPVAAGTLPIAAPSLTYAMPQNSSFFSREVRESVRAESLTIVVRDLPVEGRPAAFDGAVGRLRVSARLDAAGLRVGVPAVLTVRVEGTGNLRLAPRPRLEVPWGAVVPGPERVTMDTAGPLVRGSKEFDWILTPSSAGRDSLPALVYPYFDPQRGAYAEARTVPVVVEVAPGTLVTDGDEGTTAPEPLRAWDAGAGVPWAARVESWWLAGMAIGVAAPLVALVAGRQGRRTRPSVPAPAGPPRRGPVGETEAEPATPAGEARRRRRRFLDAVAARLGVPPEALVARDAFARLLRRHGVTREVAELALALRDQLETEGFGPVAPRPSPAGAAATADQAVAAVLARIDSEAVPAGAGPRRGTPAVVSGRRRGAVAGGVLPVLAIAALILLGVVGLISARRTGPRDSGEWQDAPADAVRETVEEAGRAYDARQFRRAAAALARAVAARPHDVTLLANWGTAAWAAADTVSAVQAWQRAARLQPWAADLQRNLARLPSGARAGEASVPLVPVAAVLSLGLIAWTAGWGLLARSRRAARGAARAGGRRGPTAAALLVVCGAVLVGWGWWGRVRLATTGLAVVRRPETLHAAPSVNAPGVGGMATGDVVRREVTRDGWTRVRHADGRRGWVPAPRLLPLHAIAQSE